MTHYWPISNHTKNMITGQSLNTFNFVSDMLGKSKSAVRVASIDDFVVIKEEITLSPNFTIMFWCRINENKHNQTLFEIGNEKTNDTIVFRLHEIKLTPSITVFNKNVVIGSVKSTKPIKLERWYQFAIVMEHTILYLFVNGEQVDQVNCISEINVLPRRRNFLGRSSSETGDFAMADFDQIKIFNKALKHNEIKSDFLNEYLNLYQKGFSG